MALSTPPIAPQRGDRTTFASRVDAFITWLIGFVSELNIYSASLNAIAAGGAYSIPTTWGMTGIGAGAAQNTMTILNVGDMDSRGRNIFTLLDEMGASTSSNKGKIRIEKEGDSTAYLLMDVLSAAAPFPGYHQIGVSVTHASSANPFNAGDSLMLYFQRTGDKGDVGGTVSALLREVYASGTAAPGLTAATWNTRALNTTSWNDIAGLSLSGNVFTLPAGKFVIMASAAAWANAQPSTLKHQIRLYNRTAGGIYDAGSGEMQILPGTNAGNYPNRSQLRTTVSVAAPTNFAIEHYVSIGVPGGVAMSNGNAEAYTEVQILKIA